LRAFVIIVVRDVGSRCQLENIESTCDLAIPLDPLVVPAAY